MNILKQTELLFKESKTNKALGYLIFYLTIPAKKKNDYTIGPFITDQDGLFILTRDEIKNMIDKEKSTFLMDYSTLFEDLDNYFKIKIDTKENIENIINGIKKYYPKESEYLKKLSESCYNKNLKENIIIERSLKNEIEVFFI